jgi:hypothetical protein
VVRILCEQVLELADGRLVRGETNA